MTSVLTVEFVGEEIVRFILFTYATDVRSVTWDDNLVVPSGLYESYVVFEYTNVTTTNIKFTEFNNFS